MNVVSPGMVQTPAMRLHPESNTGTEDDLKQTIPHGGRGESSEMPLEARPAEVPGYSLAQALATTAGRFDGSTHWFEF